MHTLYKITALLAFVASVLGCNQPHRSVTVRSSNNGVDQLYSTVDIRPEGAEFRCIASESGRCHYTLFASSCDNRTACTQAPLRQLDVAVGAEQRLSGVPDEVQVCASTSSAPVDAHCQPVS